MEQISVLAVTADREFTAACERVLPEHGDIRVVSATSVGEAIDVLDRETQVDCVISDHDLPDTDGVAFLEAVRAQAPTLPFILFTSEGGEGVASRAISAGVTDYLIKERHENQWGRLATLITDAVRYYRDQRDIVDTETRAKTLLNAAHDIVGIVRDGEIAYLNDTGVTEIYDGDRSRIANDSVADVLLSDDGTPIRDLLDAVQSGSRTLDHRNGNLIAANGIRTPVEITAAKVTWTEIPAVILVLRDVSDRRERKRKLRLTNRAIDEAPVGITIADATEPDNPLIYANDKFSELTGYRQEETLERNCRFLQGENTDPRPVAEMREAIDAEEPVTVELRNYRKDGTEFWNRVTIAPVTDHMGEVTHYVGFQEDVTERVEYQQMLRRFQRAVESAGHAIYMTDQDGTITYVNPAFERVTGYDSDEVVGQTPHVLHSGEMSDEYYDRLWATISSGNVWEEEIQDRRKSGDVYYAHQTIAPLTDDDGEIEAYVAIQQDITDRKEREFRLRQYESAVEGAKELIAAIDEEKHYLFANEAYRDFHGLDTESLTELMLDDGIGSDTYETVEPYLERAFDGETVQYRMTRSRPERADRTFDIRYYPLEDDTGHVEGIVATMRDLTEQIEREQHIASLDRMLRHTLHNELNVILGHAEMLQAQGSDEVVEVGTTIERVAGRILEQTDKQHEIVELLSNQSDPTHLNLADVVDTAVERVTTEHPDAEITVEVPADVQLLSIPELQRAIEELVENAIAHTGDGPAKVGVTATKHGTVVELHVTDNGPGIPPEERSVISGDADIDSLTHSSGMGLWLVKRIVSRTDGDIRFDDAEPTGSVVTLQLPFNT
ncbi:MULTISPECIES: sensor histidine kinase [Halolamina]|uniref:PAS domain S-box-containing protein n=1 Tax=Halolamina pelagica TaxID=699431 RepID=A0A1I5NVC4_9EURY|nr:MULTISPECIES: PAS domain S-box protein [Halolamina]NHX36499.1 PAS domain S-box protein [Halolamina sp. R1-12]SFP25758.1 PAS domain S-box-containing protein [Halolamina pelagica]